MRCGERQVRPLVEESGYLQMADPKAALRDLEMLKARSTTQFKDELQADLEPNLEDNTEEAPLPPLRDDDGDVEPSLANTEDLQERDLPGVVRMVLNSAAERDRTPRRGHQDEDRRMSHWLQLWSLQNYNLLKKNVDEISPKRKTTVELEKDDAKAPRTTTASSSADARLQQPEDDQGLAAAAATPVPTADDDDVLSVEVNIDKVIGKLPGGWKCVGGGF